MLNTINPNEDATAPNIIGTPGKIEGSEGNIKSPEIMRIIISDMDGLACEAFDEIAAIADLAMLALETPEGHRRHEMIANALSAISNKASITNDSIFSLAEGAGRSSSAREKRQVRFCAYRTAREQEVAP